MSILDGIENYQPPLTKSQRELKRMSERRLTAEKSPDNHKFNRNEDVDKQPVSRRRLEEL